MAFEATVSLNITPLPENDIWFANAQAWNNYWRDVTATITFDTVVTTQLYTPVIINTLDNVTMEIDGIPMTLITLQNYEQLLAKVESLDASYQLLRTQLKDVGFITEAQ